MSFDDIKENLLVQSFLSIIIFLAAIFIPALACKYFGDTGGAIAAIIVIILIVTNMTETNGKKVSIKIPRTFRDTNYPENWNEISRRTKQRDGHRCGNCGSTTNLHVHHIVPLSKGGTNNLSNLRTLCKDCHKLLHPHMQ